MKYTLQKDKITLRKIHVDIMSVPTRTQLAPISLKLIFSFLFSASLGVFGEFADAEWADKNFGEWLGIFCLFAGFYFICLHIFETIQKKPAVAPSNSSPSYPVFSDLQSDLKEYQYAVSGIAHDFNNILTCISGNLSMALMDGTDFSDSVRDYINDSLHAVKQASSLSNQLMLSSKGLNPVRENASLEELIKDSARFVLAGSGVSLDYKNPEKPIPQIQTDPNQISQVIQNLVLNAKQAMQNHGKINIATDIVEYSPPQRDTILTSENPVKQSYIRIAIADTGPGIDEKIQHKIFQPFFTTKKEGNGLGLANSRKILKDNNGFLDFESKKGIGTTFYIYLPQYVTA